MKKILLIIAAVLWLSLVPAYGAETGYTNISDIALYKNADYSSAVVSTLKMSTKLDIVSENEQWYNVKTPSGSSGWIEKYFVTVPPEKYVVNNTKNKINIRKSATTLSDAVAQLEPGEKARYIDTYHSWHIIEYNGKEYYVASWLTDLEYKSSQNIYILYDKVNIRGNASLSSDVLAQGNKYDSYKVVGEKNGWLQIRLDDKQDGYVAGWLTTYNRNYYSEGSISFKITIDELNIRTGPSAEDKKVGSLKKAVLWDGATAPILRRSTLWQARLYSLIPVTAVRTRVP